MNKLLTIPGYVLACYQVSGNWPAFWFVLAGVVWVDFASYLTAPRK